MYAQTLILVNLIVVIYFCVLIVARNPPERFWRKLVDMFPFNLPDLSKPPGPPKRKGKTTFRDQKLEQIKTISTTIECLA